MGHSVGDYGLGAEVRAGEDVGDVAVHEDGAGGLREEDGFRDARVGAAEPEDGGGLALREVGEEVGVFGVGFLGPGFVGLEDGVEGVCGWGYC